MRIVKLVIGILLGIALVISSIRRIPEIVARSGDSAYAQSYLFSTIGATLLFGALSVWLIVGGLKPKADGKDSDHKPT
jgi:hypothetical protein